MHAAPDFCARTIGQFDQARQKSGQRLAGAGRRDEKG
jgi:hypothetical protein